MTPYEKRYVLSTESLTISGSSWVIKVRHRNSNDTYYFKGILHIASHFSIRFSANDSDILLSVKILPNMF